MGCQASKSAVADPGTAPPPAETKPEPEVKADVKPDKSEKSDDGAGAFGSDVVQLEKITLVDADMPPIEEEEDAASPAAKVSKDSEEVSTDPSTPDAEEVS